MNALEIDGCHEIPFYEVLEKGWRRIFERGGIAYDPRSAEYVEHPPFRFHYVPGRDSRPGVYSGTSFSPEAGLLSPHRTCPFEEPELLRLREILRFQRQGRVYHIIANKYPVKPCHLLIVRSCDAPSEILPQCLFGPEEIEDMLLLARAIGYPMRFFFNSNSGSDGSSSGSTVNHWHFQLFPNRWGAVERALENSSGAGGSTSLKGKIAGWDVPHQLYCGFQLDDIAREIWRAVEVALTLDVAFNIEMGAGERGNIAAAFFPKAPIPPFVLPGVGELPQRFGGWELTGDVVVHDPAVFRWIREHPEEAIKYAWKRLHSATRDIWSKT